VRLEVAGDDAEAAPRGVHWCRGSLLLLFP
jgi:hypothetical protein